MTAAETVRKVEAAIAEAAVALDAAEVRRKAAREQLVDVDELRAGAAVGDQPPEDVEAFAAKYERERDDAAGEVERLRGTLAGLEPKLAAARAAARVELAAEFAVDYRAVCAPVAPAANKLRGILVAAVKQAAILQGLREAAGAVRVEAERSAAAAGVDLELVDEPAWRPGGCGQLVELVRVGPLMPTADAADNERRREERADLERLNTDRRRVRDAALATLQTPRLRDDEPVDEVIDRILEDHALDSSLRGAVVAERKQLIGEHLAEIDRTQRRVEENWRALESEAPALRLDESEVKWRRQNGIDVPGELDASDAARELAEEGVVTL